MQESKLLEIIGYYLSVLMIEDVIKKDAFKANLKRWKTFKDNNRIKEEFYKEMKLYLESVKVQKKVCTYLLMNMNRVEYNDIIRTFDKMDDDAKVKFVYINDLIEQLNSACDNELEYQFHVPKNKPNYVLDKNKYLNVAKGFSLDSVKEFLIDESVYTDLSYQLVKNKIKHLNVVGSDAKYVAGIFNSGIVMPEVVNDVTSLIAIHELVRNALLMYKRIINDNSIVLDETLPIFYEYLFAEYNPYVKTLIHENIDAYKLFYLYEGEPFLVQVQKLKELKHKK